MIMFTPQGMPAEVAPNQVEILLKAGWTKEKKVQQPKVEMPVVKPEPVGQDEEQGEEKKVRRILKPKE